MVVGPMLIFRVMPGLDPGIHVTAASVSIGGRLCDLGPWMAGSSPAMTPK